METALKSTSYPANEDQLSLRVQVLLALALYFVARGILILSAPDVLAMVDQATWKHADLATDLRSGQLPTVHELGALAWNGFNYHQVAFIPYSLGFALFALPLGAGYVALHLYAAAYSALGVAAWALLLARHGPRHSALAFACFAALTPLPAAMMQVRPYSGHTEAQGLAALAVALLLLKSPSLLPSTPRGLILFGLTAGAALSLSPLAAPLLLCAGLAVVVELARAARLKVLGRPFMFIAVGLLVGTLPYLIRAMFAPEDMFSMPVVEYDQADPASILRGKTGPTLGATLGTPFHLAVHLSSVTQAHSYEGLMGGDSLAANLALVAASLVCLLSAFLALSPSRRALALLLALAPWATLIMVGLAGPDLCLRYLTGIYPIGLAAFAFCAGLGLEQAQTRLASRAAKAAGLLCALAALFTWAWPGARDLAHIYEPTRWHAAIRYAPGPLLSSTGLRTMPPVSLWEETTAFLEQRKGPDGWTARGFDLPFLPEDDMSTQGWQPYPTLSSSLVAQRARLSGEGAEAELRNMGWALAASQGWNVNRFVALLSSVTEEKVLQALHLGAAEGAKLRDKAWVTPNQATEPSRMQEELGESSPTEIRHNKVAQ